jgi:hypothetical protein
LSVGVGLGVLAELLEEEVVEVVGARGKHDLERSAVRHGHESGEVTLGGRRVAVERPRVRSADGRAEVRLRTYEHFADRDQLSRVVLERMLAGVSTRGYRRTQEPVGLEVERAARSTSRSAVSRSFVERTRQADRATTLFPRWSTYLYITARCISASHGSSLSRQPTSQAPQRSIPEPSPGTQVIRREPKTEERVAVPPNGDIRAQDRSFRSSQSVRSFTGRQARRVRRGKRKAFG